MVTMEEVAKAANVSRTTVSRVLSNHPSIRIETRNHVMHWVRELGYEPNQIAQSLAGSKTNLIGVLFSDLTNPLYSALMAMIVRVAEKEGYNVIVGDAQRDRAREVNIINSFKRRKVEGIIVRPIGTPNPKVYASLKIPFVSLYKKTSGSNIIISSEEGARQAAQHFYANGHRKIGYLGPLTASPGNDKLAGFKQELLNYDINLKAVIESNQNETVENQRAYEIIMKYFLSHHPADISAWFAHNDVAASDIIRALYEFGVKVPGEVAVCGYNDTMLARKMIPTLTSIASPIDEIANRAVSLLIRSITEPGGNESIHLIPRLIIREST